MDNDIIINGGYRWPAYDHKPDKCLRMVRAGLHHSQSAINLCKDRKVCVQAGGHAGLWPVELSKYFGWVYTFEPEKTLFRCMQHNAGMIKNITMSDQALGPCLEKVKFKSHSSAGSWYVSENGEHEVDQISIDSLNLDACDAIFLDVEKYEIKVLSGAIQTIRKFNPVLHVEVLEGERRTMDQFMKAINYVYADSIGRDVIYVR